MKRVVILGGGFAGISALRRLSRARGELDVLLIDPREGHNFLPLLPDLVGRGLDPQALCYPFARAVARWGGSVLCQSAISLDLERRIVKTEKEEIAYDYLLVASGSETSFHGRADVKREAYILHSVDDAVRLCAALAAGTYDSIVVAGGGYTGVEIATHIRRFLKKQGTDTPVCVVERGKSVCASMPGAFQAYVAGNIQGMGIRILSGESIASVEGKYVSGSIGNGIGGGVGNGFSKGEGNEPSAPADAGLSVRRGCRIRLTGGEVFENALLVWAAGVAQAGFVQALDVPKDRAGRIIADAHLRFVENCFAAGDATGFVHNGSPLRMGVQFSLQQGACAAENIVRTHRGQTLKPYRPHDPGYVVPMANGRSCGVVFGVPLYGQVPTLLHYLMSAVCSYGLANRWGVIKGVLRSLRKI